MLQPTEDSFGTLFKNTAGSWKCDTCMIHNNPEVENCPACEMPHPKPKSTSSSKVTIFE